MSYAKAMIPCACGRRRFNPAKSGRCCDCREQANGNATKRRWKATGLCGNCGSPPIPGRALCAACAAKGREAARLRRLSDLCSRAEKFCETCGSSLGIDYKPKGGRPRKHCVPSCKPQRLGAQVYQANCPVCAGFYQWRGQAAQPKTCGRRECIGEYQGRQKRGRRLGPYRRTTRNCRLCGVSCGASHFCAPCLKARRRDWKRRFGSSSPARRAKARGLPRDYSIKAADVFDRDRWTCRLCGCKTPKHLRGSYDDRAPEIDHIVPLTHPNSPGHVWSNVQCACRKCNGSKGARAIGQPGLELGAQVDAHQ